jgi:AbrB family looped-hinge helix DNA binding protein
MSASIVKLSSKGQLVIPAAVRKRLGWKQNDELEIQVGEGERLIVVRAKSKKKGWESLGGSLKGGRSLTKCLEEERAAEREREDRKSRSFSTRGQS